MRSAVFVAALVLGLGLYAYRQRPVKHPPGILAPDDPEQIELEHKTPIVKDKFILEPRARFSAKVRVLGRERYYLDTMAAISPVDFAVGWGPMSDTRVIEELSISQGLRFYRWRYEDNPPIGTDIIASHSANWHLIPKDDAVRKSLLGVRTGAVVALRGLLVDVAFMDGSGGMQTSLVRTDTGAGACEILYVESVLVLP